MQRQGLCTSYHKLAVGWWRSQELAERPLCQDFLTCGLAGTLESAATAASCSCSIRFNRVRRWLHVSRLTISRFELDQTGDAENFSLLHCCVLCTHTKTAPVMPMPISAVPLFSMRLWPVSRSFPRGRFLYNPRRRSNLALHSTRFAVFQQAESGKSRSAARGSP